MAQIFNIHEDGAKKVLAGSSCAFGVFDGVHSGHRFLLDSACTSAAELNCKSVALTFDVDPDELFRGDSLKKLSTNEDRIEMLAQSGVDAVVVLRFDSEFASLSPQVFLNEVFGGCAPSCIHVGRDFRFGCKASGDVEMLKDWAALSHSRVFAHDLISVLGEPVTATRIRGLLSEGDVQTAEKLLGYPYTLHDTVIAGRGEGGDMGFKTANLIVEPARRVLREGVYAAYALVDGVRYKAAVSIGVSPTFRERTEAYSEVHILDFDEDIYGRDVCVQFKSWLRPMIEFQSVDELIQTVMGNIAWVRDNL